VARGGDGGRGNAAFATSTNRAPTRTDPGWPGAEVTVRLELKLLADVGIVGLPNAGKSSFINRISACKAKVADYPFTTLVPNLGVVERFAGFPFVVADVPGLIEGAHAGKGLGLRFLKHVERTTVLLHVLDASHEKPSADWRSIRKELDAFGGTLASKPELVALNKMDLIPPEERTRKTAALNRSLKRHGRTCFPISAATGEGCDDLLKALARLLKKHKAR
jgi:GTP-binding protein